MPDSNISIIKILIIFYLLSINAPNHILSKQLKKYIESNKLVQHFISFITIYVLISLLTNDNIIIYSIITYALFVLISKTDIHINIIILLLLLCAYYYETILNKKTCSINTDNIMTNNEKTKLNNYINTNKYNIGLCISIAIILGAMCYSYKKQLQYDTKYNIIEFIVY